MPPAPPPPEPPPLSEAPLEAAGAAAFAVGPIRETASQDHRTVAVEGTIENVGTRPSRSVRVWVNALDAQGLPLARVEAVPTPQEIPPGTAARFVVELPNDPDVRTYHVEVVGR